MQTNRAGQERAAKEFYLPWVNPAQPPSVSAMRSPLPFPGVPDRPSKILLVQVGTLSFSHPLFGVSVLFIYYWARDWRALALTQAKEF